MEDHVDVFRASLKRWLAREDSCATSMTGS